jgi:hypothetical protein
VLGRALGFSDPEVIRLLKERFIPVVGDDWYQRRRKDEVGAFFRSVVDQTWKAGKWEPGGGDNRQGVYCFTPSGRMLTEMKNVGSLPDELRRLLESALRSWDALPAEQRRAGSVEVRDVAFDPGYHRPVPAGALVLRQFQRGLRRAPDGSLAADEFKFREAPVWAQRDRAWVLENEWKALVPASPAPGAEVEVPATLRNRLLRFHFVEALVGEPGMWSADQIRSASLKLVVDAVTPQAVRFHLSGSVLLSTEPDAARSRCGLEGNLAGILNFDRSRGAFDRFDVALVADCWGALNLHNAVSRKGRNPVGFLFELGSGAPADRVPPQGARVLQPYLNPT